VDQSVLPAQVAWSVLEQMDTGTPLFRDSLLATVTALVKSLARPATRLLLTNQPMEGMASDRKTRATTRATMSSTRVKPWDLLKLACCKDPGSLAEDLLDF
jgi:hypothetical protein